MNMMMWENKAVQRNIQTLKNDSIHFVGPESGNLACGEEGQGRMSEVEQIFEKIRNLI